MGVKVSPSGKLENEPDLVQHTYIGQQETYPVTISRHIESDYDGGSSPREPSLRDPPHSKNINIEPVLQSVGVKDDETSVNKEESTSTSPNTQQGRSISSQVAAVNATAKDKYGAVRNQFVLQNKTAKTTSDENKFFYPVGEQEGCALSSRSLPSSGRD